MLAGLLVPVLAAAPFYVLDSRAERRAAQAELSQHEATEQATPEASEHSATIHELPLEKAPAADERPRADAA